MDKNTITGFVLIGIVLLVFSWINRPTPEQIEAQRRYQDSIAHIEQVQQQEWQASQLETTNDRCKDYPIRYVKHVCRQAMALSQQP